LPTWLAVSTSSLFHITQTFTRENPVDAILVEPWLLDSAVSIGPITHHKITAYNEIIRTKQNVIALQSYSITMEV